jgi:hypothetical protein
MPDQDRIISMGRPLYVSAAVMLTVEVPCSKLQGTFDLKRVYLF